MILADKIIYLRKKAGWSQEELAEKMGVSRQSISKWEGALSVPDMNRILKLSELFDVSTDYLLRDEMEEEEKNPAADEKIADETGEKLVPVSMELANDYLAHCKKVSVPCAFGVFLCIMSPVFLLLLSGAGEAGLISLTEDQGALLGTAVLILLIVAAVSIFVITGHYDEKYEFLEKEALDTAYGVDGMVRDRRQKYERSHVIELAAGVALCVASCIPIFLMLLLFGEENVMALTGAISLLLFLVATGVFLIVRTCIIWDGYQVLLEEGDYTRIAKKQNKRISGIYWGCVTAVYLLVSFLTMEWNITWVIWPVAGILWGVISSIYRNQVER